MEAVLGVLLVGAVAGLLWTARRWQQERRRAERLEQDLARARERDASKPPPPLKAVLQTAVRVRDEGLGEVLRTSLEELAGGLTEESEPELRRLVGDDGTLTICFSDIENSTALNEDMGDRSWLKVLGAHDRIVRRAVERNRGYVVKSQGDGFMIAFGAADEALRSAVQIQRAFESPPRSLRGKNVAVRIGAHTGPALERDGDLFGLNVALAARIADQAGGGEIVVTEAVCEAADEADDLQFNRLREVELKGLPGTHTLYAVDRDGG